MSGTDPNTAVLTAENAAKNNAVFTTAVVVVAAINAVSIGWSAYDVYQAYKKGGVESAVEQLAVEGLIAVATVGAGKVVYKIGGIAFKSAADAWAYYAKSDKAFALVEKAAAATKAAGATVKRAAERLLPRSRVITEGMPKILRLVPSSGIKIAASPGKTTTILGNYDQDMSQIIRKLNYPKTLDFGAKTGGFNILNTPNRFYESPSQFWNQYNKPFLDRAIGREDDIVLATKPENHLMKRVRPDGKIELSDFGREMRYLKKHGYYYDPVTSMMRKK